MKASLKLWNAIFTVSLVLLPTLICGGLLYFYLRDELDNRRMIAFMNFEQIGHRFDRSLETIDDFLNDDGNLRFSHVPLALVAKRGTANAVITGAIPEGVSLKVIPAAHCDVQSVSNLNYILCPILLPTADFQSTAIEAGHYWGVWRLTDSFFEMFEGAKPSRIFMVNSHGKLIYQSDSRQPQKELLHKPFVQEYIRLPLAKEATAPYTELKDQVLGFAMNLQHTNVTFFVESPASLVFASLWKPTLWVLASLFFGVAVLSLLGRLAISGFREQVETLSASLDAFAQGRQIPLQHNPKDYLTDLGRLVRSLNDNSLEIRELLDKTAGRIDATNAAAEEP